MKDMESIIRRQEEIISKMNLQKQLCLYKSVVQEALVWVII